MSNLKPLILVTGASGYVATHIIQQLLKAGHRVRGTVRNLQCEEKVQPLRQLCPDAEHPLALIEAELLATESWTKAVDGSTYVIHTASPFPAKEPNNEGEVTQPAVDGTLNVLRACSASKTVKRVVLTSSVAAISGGFENESDKVYTEDDWANVDGIPTYQKSKTLAEKAAWDFVKTLSGDEAFDLCTINPVYIMGPVLCGGLPTSLEFAKRLLERQMPLVPELDMPLVDVRDVAAAHIIALTSAEAVGNRHILYTESIWLIDMAKMISAEFSSQGYRVPTSHAPYCVLWLMSLFDASICLILKSIGKVTKFDKSRMHNTLGIKPRAIRDTIIDMCYSMIDRGMVKRTHAYHGRPTTDKS